MTQCNGRKALNRRTSLILASAVTILSATACVGGAEDDTEPVPTDVEAASAQLGSSGSTRLQIVSAVASANDGNVAANAVDADASTRWSALGPGVSLTTDLGAVRSVRDVGVSWYRGDQRKTTFTLALSTNRTTWKTVYDGQSSGTTASFESYAFAEMSARYVRLTVSGNTENRWASVTDVEIFGGPIVAKLLEDTFTAPDGLISNEYAYWNPTHADAVSSNNWEMNSGSLFTQGNAAWSGVPDGSGPNALSTNATDSAVFRMMTKRADFADVGVSFGLRNMRLVTTSRTPAVDWDGIHLWLRYQAENSMYYTSVNRRDGTVVIKKKVPGGPTNGGTYYILTSSIPHVVPYGAWQQVKATTKNNSDGSVTISLYADGVLLASAVDKGTGGPPIRSAGKLGIRGDNCEFHFDNFVVEPL